MSAITNMLDGFVNKTMVEPEIVQKWGLGTIDEWRPGYVKKVWCVAKSHLLDTSLFGGCIAALADQMLAFPAITLQQDGEFCATSNLTLSYLKPVREGQLIIEAEVVSRRGKSFYVEAKFSQNNELVAKAAATQITVVGPR